MRKSSRRPIVICELARPSLCSDLARSFILATPPVRNKVARRAAMVMATAGPRTANLSRHDGNRIGYCERPRPPAGAAGAGWSQRDWRLATPIAAQKQKSAR